jgi:hypothetical protein
MPARPTLGPPVTVDEVSRCIRSFVTPGEQRPWGLYLTPDDDGPVAQAARWVEWNVFGDTYEVSRERMAAEYDPYTAQSSLALVVHHGAEIPVAAVRLIWGHPSRLKLFQDWLPRFEAWREITWEAMVDHHRLDLSHDRIAEIATFSVLPEWRSADARWPVKLTLVGQMLLAWEGAATHLACEIDALAARAFYLLSGVQFEPICGAEPAMSMGSPSVLGLVDVVRFWEWFAPRGDEEFRQATAARDERARGGTRLPAIELRQPSALRLLADDACRLGLRPAERP